MHGPEQTLVPSTSPSLRRLQSVSVHTKREIHTVKANLSGVDIALFQLRECLQKKLVAVRALKICEFDDCQRSILRTQEWISPHVDLYGSGGRLCLCGARYSLCQRLSIDQSVNKRPQLAQFRQNFVGLFCTYRLLSFCRDSKHCHHNDQVSTTRHQCKTPFSYDLVGSANRQNGRSSVIRKLMILRSLRPSLRKEIAYSVFDSSFGR